MKTFYLILALTANTYLYPCEWIMEVIEKKENEYINTLHQFDGMALRKPDLWSTYWYCKGQLDAAREIIEDIDKGN